MSGKEGPVLGTAAHLHFGRGLLGLCFTVKCRNTPSTDGGYFNDDEDSSKYFGDFFCMFAFFKQ